MKKIIKQAHYTDTVFGNFCILFSFILGVIGAGFIYETRSSDWSSIRNGGWVGAGGFFAAASAMGALGQTANQSARNAEFSKLIAEALLEDELEEDIDDEIDDEIDDD